MKISSEHLREWAKLSREWRIQMLNTHTETRAGTRYQTLWFYAVCEETKASRRYRVWFNESLSPPYRKQQGWELFDDEGSVCDREIRYSRRDDSNYLH